MSKLDKIAILLGAVGAIVLVVEEPMTGGSWATRLRGQPALVVPTEPVPVSALPGFDQAQGRGL